VINITVPMPGIYVLTQKTSCMTKMQGMLKLKSTMTHHKDTQCRQIHDDDDDDIASCSAIQSPSTAIN